MPEKPEKLEKKESYQPAHQGGAYGGGQGLPSQASVDLLTRLLQEFERRSTPAVTTIPPEVERDIAIVTAAFDSIERALSLRESPIAIDSVTPDRGAAAGGTRVTICGSHLLPGSTVRFGNGIATDLTVVSFSEIQVTTPPRPPAPGYGGYGGDLQVDVVINTLGGSATRARGYTYQSS